MFRKKNHGKNASLHKENKGYAIFFIYFNKIKKNFYTGFKITEYAYITE